MSLTDDYNPLTALTGYYRDRTERAVARLFAGEKLAHDAGFLGLLQFFEGPGDDPTLLEGYAATKLWLRQNAGVQPSQGTFRKWNGGPQSSLANWPELTPAGYLAHLSGLGGITPGVAGSDYPTRAAAEQSDIALTQLYVRTAGFAAPDDAGGAMYARAGSATPGGFQDAGGNWWKIVAADCVNLAAFGIQDDDEEFDCAPAMNAAVLFLTSQATRGGKIEVPRGRYFFQSTIVIDQEGIEIRGQGTTDMWLPSSWGRAPTELVFLNLDGDCIRIRKSSSSIDDLRIDAGADRAAQAFDVTKNGVRWEADDTDSAAERVNYPLARNLHVIRQPGHGVAVIGNSVGLSFDTVCAVANKGHGIVVDRGDQTNRTNKNIRPGIATLINCRAHDNGGHGLCVGHPANGINIPYRVIVRNFESYRNALAAGARHSAHDMRVVAENSEISHSAVAGQTPDGTPNVGSGIWVAGRCIGLQNNRYISTLVPVTVGVHTGLQTNGISVVGGVAIGGTDRPVFLEAEATVVNVDVHLPFAAGFTRLTASTSNILGLRGRIGALDATGESSALPATIADDGVRAYEFSGVTSGVMIVSSSTAGRKAAMVHFRVGDGARHAALMTTGISDVAVATGALTGTTGEDGDLTISADAAEPKIYVENRTGVAGSYRVDFIGLIGGYLVA